MPMIHIGIAVHPPVAITEVPVSQQMMKTYVAVSPKVLSTLGSTCSGTSSVVISSSRAAMLSPVEGWGCWNGHPSRARAGLAKRGGRVVLLLDRAVLHADDAAGLVGDRRVVGARDDGDAESGAQVAEKLHDHRPGAVVEVGGGFVGQDQPRVADQRARDGRALLF